MDSNKTEKNNIMEYNQICICYIKNNALIHSQKLKTNNFSQKNKIKWNNYSKYNREKTEFCI